MIFSNCFLRYKIYINYINPHSIFQNFDIFISWNLMTRKHIYTQTVSILSSFFYSSASTTLIISRFFIQFTSPFLNYSLCFSKIFFIFPAHTHPPTVRFATPIATAILCFLSKYKIKHNIYIQNICTFAFFPYLSFSH